MRTNTAKAKLKAGQTILGCFVRYSDPTLAEVLSLQSWDFLLFDGEHGTIEPRDCENLVRACEVRGMTPLVRVPTNQPYLILRYLDSGAHGLHVPWVNSAAEAEAVVRSVKYTPRGIRGLAGVRASDYGQGMPLGEYVQQANAETLVVIHLETVEAVKDLPQIVKVDGLDVIFIGPTDLSQSMGLPGQTTHPRVQEVMRTIADTVLKTDLALGVLAPTVAIARQWKERGARYLVTGMDAILRPAAEEFLRAIRA